MSPRSGRQKCCCEQHSFLSAVARSAGSISFLRLILGLTPQAGVPSRASRLGWKTLRCRALRALLLVSQVYGSPPPGRGPRDRTKFRRRYASRSQDTLTPAPLPADFPRPGRARRAEKLWPHAIGSRRGDIPNAGGARTSFPAPPNQRVVFCRSRFALPAAG